MPQSYAEVFYHLIYRTKYKRIQIPRELTQELYAYSGGIIKSDKGILIAAGGVPDHVQRSTKSKIIYCNQEEHHKKLTFVEELILLYDQYGIPIEQRALRRRSTARMYTEQSTRGSSCGLTPG